RLGVLLRRRGQRAAPELAAMIGVSLDRLGPPAARPSGGNPPKGLPGRGPPPGGAPPPAPPEPPPRAAARGPAQSHHPPPQAARRGRAVIFSSTELEEVLDLADVVVTLFHGRIVSVVPRSEASASAILADMTTSRREPGEGPS